jgi:predicted esterase
LRANYKNILLLFILITSISCTAEKPKKVVFISEPLTNRVDLKKSHDSGCLGFYKNFFSVNSIKSEMLINNNLSVLSKQTGINWQIVDKNEPFFDFNKFFIKLSLDSKQDTLINKQVPKEIINKVVYLAEVIENSKDEIKFLSIGSDDGFVLWLNGDSVYSHHEGRSMYPNSDIVPLKLKKGYNVLLFKVDQSFGGWSLYYNFITKDEFDNKFFSEIYSDILDACIIPDTSTEILVKPDPRRKLYNQYSYNLIWKTIENSPKEFYKVSFRGYDLPLAITLPAGFKGVAILEISVLTENNKIVYQEDIPIFFESVANNLALNLDRTICYDNPIFTARKNAVVDMFLVNNTSEKREFNVSTRTKAHALLDLFESVSFYNSNLSITGPRVFGYKSKFDNSVQVFRTYLPSSLGNRGNSNKSYPLIYTIRPINVVMYDTLTKKQLKSNFLRSRDFCSHSQMIKWLERVERNKVVVVSSHGHGLKNFLDDATEEFPQILHTLDKYYNLDTNNISIFAYSSGAELALKLLKEIKIKISNVGFIGGAISIKSDSLKILLKEIKMKFPLLKFIIRQGLDDEKQPAKDTRRWVQLIKEAGFKVDYDEIPYAGHDIGFDRYGDELIKKILVNDK